MPSCVVKICHNRSGSNNKSQGITFHRFPSENIAWRNDWLQIIRHCRKESDWSPSKSSVVCSIHFEENDLYRTKGGLLRVVTYAVPKKFLYEASKAQQSDEANTSSVLHEFSLETSIIKEEESAEANTSSILHEFQLEITNIKEEESAQANTSSVLHEFSLETSNIKEEESAEANTSSALHEESSKESPKTLTPSPEFELEEPLSVLYTSRIRRMKIQLMKMHTLRQSHKKKIKTLNQKVRRLQDRNKSLVNILKTLKENNYIDLDLCNKLNENITAANIFSNLNNKKRNKKIKYSPSMKKFCLTLNYYSPKAYDYVRETLNTCLPHRKTLSKWYGHINEEPGLTEESVHGLKVKAQLGTPCSDASDSRD